MSGAGSAGTSGARGEIEVETTGESVGEAKWAALRELERKLPGLSRESVRFVVVSEGERGLLGIGQTPARVIATASAGALPEQQAPADELPQAAQVRELLERTIAAAGLAASVAIDVRDDEIAATLVGDDLGVLIGRHGQTIDALQYLANAIARGAAGLATPHLPVVVDAAGYRVRRSAAIADLARRTADRVASTGEREALEAMTAVERKLVHQLLEHDSRVTTVSEGSEPHRFVAIVPRPL